METSQFVLAEVQHDRTEGHLGQRYRISRKMEGEKTGDRRGENPRSDQGATEHGEIIRVVFEHEHSPIIAWITCPGLVLTSKLGLKASPAELLAELIDRSSEDNNQYALSDTFKKACAAAKEKGVECVDEFEMLIQKSDQVAWQFGVGPAAFSFQINALLGRALSCLREAKSESAKKTDET